MDEQEPLTTAAIHDEDIWKPIIISKLHDKIPENEIIKKLPKNIRQFYSQQQEIIESFEEVDEKVDKMPNEAEDMSLLSHNGSILSVLDNLVGRDNGTWRGNRLNSLSIAEEDVDNEENKSSPADNAASSSSCCCRCCCSACRCAVGNYMKSRKGQTFLAKMTLLCNLILLGAKIIAVVMSLSLSIISSLLDSCVDLVSGAVLWWAARTMQRSDRRLYPQGRTRLEPIAIIVLAVVMSVTSFQIIREAVEKIIQMATAGQGPPNMNNVAIAITAFTIILKILMYLVCKRFGTTSSVEALATDHRNDVFSNLVVLIFSTLSDRAGVDELKYLDPIGAILVSFYIIFNWFRTGKEHVRSLTGHVASAAFHQKICYLVLSHHPAIVALDTVMAVHYGQNYMVEVHVVLPHNMTLTLAHNIGEALQRKLEALPEVERAFVHLDYETRHRATHEHKIVV